MYGTYVHICCVKLIESSLNCRPKRTLRLILFDDLLPSTCGIYWLTMRQTTGQASSPASRSARPGSASWAWQPGWVGRLAVQGLGREWGRRGRRPRGRRRRRRTVSHASAPLGGGLAALGAATGRVAGARGGAALGRPPGGVAAGAGVSAPRPLPGLV